MNWWQIVLGIVGFFSGIGAMSAGIGYAMGQFKEGRDKEKLTAVNLLKVDVETLRAEVTKLTDEVHKLREENELERKKFTEAILIMQGRDPQMAEFIKSGNDYMILSKPVIEDLREYLKKQII